MEGVDTAAPRPTDLSRDADDSGHINKNPMRSEAQKLAVLTVKSAPAPPPPRYSSPGLAADAARAAAQAAQYAAPAQRERIIMDAVSRELAQHTSGASEQTVNMDRGGGASQQTGNNNSTQQPGSKPAPRPYQPPPEMGNTPVQ